MVFNSVVFLFGFLPLALLLYYLVPGRLKNAVLLLESLAFYCWTGVQYLPLIAFLVVFNYIWGVLEELLTRRRPLLLTISVLVNLAALVYFCINYPASKGIEAIERRMRRGDKQ